MFRRSRVARWLVGPALVASFVLVAPAHAVEQADLEAADEGAAWIVSQQQPDGGFEVAGFAGFETPDAVLAIGTAAQSDSTWSTTEARAAIEALAVGGGGPTPIDSLDAWVASGVNAGEASKLLLLVVEPLGLDAQDFGPSHHDLAAIVYPSGCGSPPATSGLFFVETTFVAFGGQLLCGAPDEGVITTIRDAQRADGGWNYLGDADDDPAPADSDLDTTALAVQALVAGGATWDDPAITKALAYIDSKQSTDGAFEAFGSDDPNATAVATLAIAAIGFDPGSSCWRDTAAPERAGTEYSSPGVWLRGQQQPDGRFASPNDGFGVNTFATSQSIEALLPFWLPAATASGAPDCSPESSDPSAPSSESAEVVPRFTG